MKTHEVMRFMGRETVNVAEIVEYEPGRKTTFKTIAGPLSATGDRLVESEGAGARLTYQAEAELIVWFRLLSPLIERSFRRRLRGDLERVKELLEANDPP